MATAVYDGADAVMLSAESATGSYPVETVAMMDRIICRTEGHKLYRSLITASGPSEEETPPHAIASATASLADAVGAAAIVAYTPSGTTPPRRPQAAGRADPGAHADLATSRRFLLWGAHSVRSPVMQSYELRSGPDVSFSGCGLVSAPPQRPSDHVSGLNAPLRQAHRHAPDLLYRPADQSAG